MPLLRVHSLSIEFRTASGWLSAVEDLSFTVEPGETLAVVGESGCGKSVTAMSLLRLIPEPPARITGQAWFNGVDLLAQPEAALRRIRGNAISMIFQEPATSLNPVLTVGRQIGEALRLHAGLTRGAATQRTEELLALVGIPAPA